MSIYKKLNDFKSKVGAITKDANNPFHKNKYATIESVLKTIEQPLSDVGLGFYQSVEDMALKTVVYDSESDNIIISTVPLILAKQDMQQLGSAITYARRYGLVAIFGLEQEDDDGNNASGYNNKNHSQNNNSNSSNAPKEYINEHQAKELATLYKNKNRDIQEVLKFFKVDGLLKLTVKQFGLAKYKANSNEALQ